MLGQGRKQPEIADVVTIDVCDHEPDVLKRVALLTGAMFRVMAGSKLVEVLEADWEVGHLEMVVEHRPTHPRLDGRVAVQYRPAEMPGPLASA